MHERSWRAVISNIDLVDVEVSLAQTKALLNEGADQSMRASLAGESRAQAVNLATADAREAFAAFTEKREPLFTGRWAIPG